MFFTCENCKHQENNFDSIKIELLNTARTTGWGSKWLFKCIEPKCRNHEDNLDESNFELGIYQPERSKREDLDCCKRI